ncbi:MAG: HK97 gp10 family phage protein [Candidatus Omnitrophica bacterium]|nr:HK97 gp10 family phage protein [Candidatus Omnitrophota bacterium]
MLDLQVTAFGNDKIKWLLSNMPKIRHKTKTVIAKYAINIERLAKGRAPKKTGTLRREIQYIFENDGLMATIGVPKDSPASSYAKAQEYNEYYRHTEGEWGYMRKSLIEVKEDFKKEVEEAFKIL